MFRKRKRASVDDKGENNTTVERQKKGKTASTDRPTACLPLVWKLLIGIIAEEVYEFLDINLLLPQEQKGYRRKSKGTNDLLFIDRMIMREVKMRKQNLSMAWIDYKKAYESCLTRG